MAIPVVPDDDDDEAGDPGFGEGGGGGGLLEQELNTVPDWPEAGHCEGYVDRHTLSQLLQLDVAGVPTTTAVHPLPVQHEQEQQTGAVHEGGGGATAVLLAPEPHTLDEHACDDAGAVPVHELLATGVPLPSTHVTVRVW
jgi:hypothetical protein